MGKGNNGLDAFEQKLRDSLDQFEVPYNSADWAQMDKALNAGGRGWWLSKAGMSLIAAAVIAVGGTTWYMFQGTEAASMLADDHAKERNVSDPAQSNSDSTAPKGQVVVEPQGTQNDAAQPSATEPAGLKTTGTTIAPSKSTPTSPTTEVSTTDTKTVGSVNTTTTSKPSMLDAASTKGITKASEKPELGTFTASVSEACAGASVVFKVANMPTDGIYLWNFGDGTFSTQANPEHPFTKPGRYQVMLSMSATGVGTIQNKPSSDIIVIHEAPQASFNVLKQEYDGHLPSVHFENRSLGGKKYHWDFGDGQTSNIPHPDHIYKSKGVYQVTLSVTNEIGCEDIIMKDVRIEKDYNLDAPASFSPDGDGVEETFLPEALRNLGLKFNFTVYSPNGNLLYQTSDASKPWLGRPQNRGDICGEGEYTWVVDVRESLHLSETYSGKVKLLKKK